MLTAFCAAMFTASMAHVMQESAVQRVKYTVHIPTRAMGRWDEFLEASNAARRKLSQVHLAPFGGIEMSRRILFPGQYVGS